MFWASYHVTVAWKGLTMADQYDHLVGIGHVVREAAAAAIASGKCNTAMEWSEQGRCIIWGQLLHLRASLYDELRCHHPQLASGLLNVSRALDLIASRDSLMTFQPMEQKEQLHHQLALKWESLVQRARTIPGFEDFLRPKLLPQLANAARDGPVVLNVHERRCDALVLIPDLKDVVHIPLDSFSFEQALELQQFLNRVASNQEITTRGISRRRKLETFDIESGHKRILSDLWVCVVKPVLEGLAFSVWYYYH